METKSVISFPSELFEKVDHYVYRLIDPRDGSTFYVGQGIGNRVFGHIDEARKGVASAESEPSDKLKTIRDILDVRLEPIHVIHRHGMTQDEADEVEAALIDIFPGLTNEQGGFGSAERGPAHVTELILQYGAKEMEFLPTDKLLLIKINKTIAERGVYEAVRHAWKIKVKRAQKAEYVLAIDRGICRGVFKPDEWLPATCENFPTRTVSAPERYGFVDQDQICPDSIQKRFIGKRIPKALVKKGKATPFEYVGI